MHLLNETNEPWPPPLPESQGFVAPPVPSVSEAVLAFAKALLGDPTGGIHVILRGLGVLVLAATCIPLHLLWRKIGAHSPWSRRFMIGATRLCGIRVKIIGKPAARKTFFVSNHLSWTDALILGGLTGGVFVAQDGIAKWPVLHFICSLNDTVFVRRSDRLGVVGQIDEMRTQFERHKRLILFPEGTCGDGRRLLPFKPALFAMLTPAPADTVLQPVVIDCDEPGRNLAWLGLETGAANCWRLLARSGSWEVRVHFLDPISPGAFADRKSLAMHSRTVMAKRLSETLGGRRVL
ncbi:MAG: 1-acyl-sn-glycerol-3-phosphate acyltransferase [Gammaproteobacteria bacterium]|jgi:1-acyl-sn-glycerol-3-phosphate acyltransferase|nr:1-acyl-sn-glycerol-3-phosphate acyltransferase [Gammaproteobacteria bacterium]NBP08259.1 1-acyl-sn-glycerol-3-phosphate acyltransferase [Gammaproteobacteria bacterium]